MGVRIQELPETTGINKEDVLIVEDGQGTKKGTVQQLDEALGVSQLKEDLSYKLESDCIAGNNAQYNTEQGVLSIYNEVIIVDNAERAVLSVKPYERYIVTSWKWSTNFPNWLFYNNDECISYEEDEQIDYLYNRIIKVPPACNKLIINKKADEPFSIRYAVPMHVDDMFINRVYKNIECGVNNSYWKNKKIVWFGTSIPDGVAPIGESGEWTSYPLIIGKMLGATIYNESVSSSAVRFGNYEYINSDDPHGIRGQYPDNFFYSLSASSSEKQAYFDNWDNWGKKLGVGNGTDRSVPYPIDNSLKEKSLNCSYDRKLDKYLSGGEVGQVDLYVFDHGHNEEFNGDYSHIKDMPPTDDIMNRSYFIGAMNFLINRILSDNPKARICFVGHYENDRKTGISEAQITLHEKWKFPLIKTWEHIGWSQNKIGNKTITQVWLPDDLHPSSDTTGKAIEHYANVLYPLIRDVR